MLIKPGVEGEQVQGARKDHAGLVPARDSSWTELVGRRSMR
jgi:hypothetical protein